MKINDLKIGDKIKYKDNTWQVDREAIIIQINKTTIEVKHNPEFALDYFISKKDIISKLEPSPGYIETFIEKEEINRQQCVRCGKYSLSGIVEKYCWLCSECKNRENTFEVKTSEIKKEISNIIDKFVNNIKQKIEEILK